jgi:hypothetical protein
MNPCPCGLTREELVELATQLLALGGRCTAEAADGSQCGRRLADHPPCPTRYEYFLVKN